MTDENAVSYKQVSDECEDCKSPRRQNDLVGQALIKADGGYNSGICICQPFKDYVARQMKAKKKLEARINAEKRLLLHMNVNGLISSLENGEERVANYVSDVIRLQDVFTRPQNKSKSLN